MQFERKETGSTNLTISEQTIQKILLIILCIMTFQPLVGSLTILEGSTEELFHAAINNFFLRKSEMVRYNGYIALALAILFSILKDKVSLADTVKSLYYKKPWNLCFSLLLIWTIISALGNTKVLTYFGIQEYALNGDPYRFEGLFSIIAYVGFFAAASMITVDRYKRIWMHVAVIAATMLAAMSLYSLWAENPRVLTYMNRQILGTGPLSSTFPQFNHYGYYLCVMTVMIGGLFVTEKQLRLKILYFVLYSFQFFTLVINGTRGAYIGTLSGLMIMTLFGLFRREEKLSFVILWIAFIVITVLNTVFFSARVSSIVSDFSLVVSQSSNMDQAGSSRIFLWKNAFEIIKLNPIWGFGLNSAAYTMVAFRDVYDSPHNEYLQHTIDLGLIGISLYLGGLTSLFISTTKKLREIPAEVFAAGCCAVGYSVSAFFGVTIVQVLPFFYICLGFVKWEKKADEENLTSMSMGSQ